MVSSRCKAFSQTPKDAFPYGGIAKCLGKGSSYLGLPLRFDDAARCEAKRGYMSAGWSVLSNAGYDFLGLTQRRPKIHRMWQAPRSVSGAYNFANGGALLDFTDIHQLRMPG